MTMIVDTMHDNEYVGGGRINCSKLSHQITHITPITIFISFLLLLQHPLHFAFCWGCFNSQQYHFELELSKVVVKREKGRF